ncbi:MAG: protein-glutamate O-methylesterase CheR [Alphaproteobacteria bacterium]|jgi:chemotaxis protein methyltransferase CheR|uniref:protein-glutamate O-methyltransferase CheR n=1 Tax=Rhizobium/Agrobacterium group TaxID=227290 RepID=UPI0006B92EB3|nr:MULTISPECIES: protein-glutamate O-methyltransferase CheR [Rhizobium/Agrobacterium group]MBU0737700.1 protein-glutamate O-methylesterase CheR [Alphaproteobacteria bacterium]MDM7979250.1 protein-glutamate O-methyltransferase CheR [Rhizobium sp.]AOG08504.1 cheR methyltransferase, SAM binding domain protein [Agrobacterium sp. RAC06]KPF55242.1 chemotaxis protein [Rhizobium sp. AAP116]MBU0834480.1 protein-glutamate O-methylesterase CheR [Alphaproteobacteria bacterium]
MTFAMSTSRQSDDEVLASGEYPLTRRDLNEIAAMIYSDAGIALNDSKASLVYSRLSKHIRNLGLSGFRAYCQLVASPEGSAERREMLSHLTTNFTRFFRENHHFEHLRDEVLPGLIQRAKSGGRVRIWSAASSDGQEPYSIALTVFQAFPNVLDYDFKILATDIDPKILAIARQGAYDEQALETVSPAIRKQWFKEVEIGGRRKFQVDDRLKRLITYNELNLMAQWPFKGKFDVIFCRNVVIYFDEPTQMRIWTRFADLLPIGGHLYIGHSERVSGDSKNDFDNIGITTYRYIGKNGGRK